MAIIIYNGINIHINLWNVEWLKGEFLGHFFIFINDLPSVFKHDVSFMLADGINI